MGIQKSEIKAQEDARKGWEYSERLAFLLDQEKAKSADLALKLGESERKREALRASLDMAKEDRKYKMIFYLTQMGWLINTKQQPQATYMTFSFDGRRARLIILWAASEYRIETDSALSPATFRVLNEYGFKETKLPNQ